MRVRVKLHGETKRGVRGLVGDVLEAEVPDELTVGQLLERLGVDLGEVWMSAVNKEVVRTEHRVRDGDSIEVFAPVAGGSAAVTPWRERTSGGWRTATPARYCASTSPPGRPRSRSTTRRSTARTWAAAPWSPTTC